MARRSIAIEEDGVEYLDSRPFDEGSPRTPYSNPREARAAFRAGEGGLTTGVCPGYLQANLVVVRGGVADDFESFCMANPSPLPLLDRTSPGCWSPPYVAPEADLRTDLPGYRVFRDGVLVGEVPDVVDFWSPDMIGILLGCSFTVEHALMSAGCDLVSVRKRQHSPVFRSSVMCEPSERFRGPVAVMMRPIGRPLIETMLSVCAEFPASHGVPLQIGSPEHIGIQDLAAPDWGVALPLSANDVPVFWGCGLTAEAVIAESRPDIALTHAPGQMFITDIECDAVRGRAVPLYTKAG